MYAKFVQVLQQSGMADLMAREGGVLVAYSGGADSTLLLHFCHTYCRTNALPLYAVHVHHGIRGEEADRDVEHCMACAQVLDIPLYVYHRDIPTLAKERSIGLEECARLERYVCFDEACVAIGKPSLPIATAHNGDDQLETILFHMLRGSGLTGMCGIAPIRDDRYIRPLLSFSGAQIRQTCVAEGYDYVEDSTNADTAYTRNYLRHEVLPRLRQISPHPETAACHMAALLTQDNDCLQKQAEEILAQSDCDGTLRISRQTLRGLHPAIGTRVLRIALERSGDRQTSMTKEQTDTLLAMACDNERSCRSLSLPGKHQACIDGETVYFASKTKPTETIPADVEIPTIEWGETVVVDWKNAKIVLSRKNLPTRPGKLENIYNLSIQRPMNFATIKGVLCLRTRRPGDTIRYGGLSRKVRKLQNAYHTPPECRDTMLLLSDAEEVLWVEGWQVCDKAKWTEDTEDVLWIEIYTKGPDRSANA